ncbi:MAG: DUF3035 domain-containing protein [Sphingomonadales bacterium]|jgi:hypothetical protein|nr:DUF3035 domain-containing protein [Sphingomonadales bacterium]MBK9004681.1 DUF3035 domain-containing protein [Sphingomonadales bacterium]MBK9269863.1 DUF3035 domain-containing protein [Sphingomonadales bacterium]MBP6433821.1 DUF3035 domain-containing protein [Sphingorhabdus sp.]
MKQKLILAAAASAILLGLSGCQSVGNAYQSLYDWDIRGNEASQQPGTSRVAPLVVPPDYPLKPSQVATTRAQDGSTPEQVLEAMFGGDASRSAGERAVVAAAGNSEMGIRSTVGDPETTTVNKGAVTRDIIAAPEGDGQAAQAAVPQ